ncbi:MAG: AAA family ATPase [Succinivibrio sp.]|nr:AAA family ATPase [Succinivibrio sp.]
MDEYLNPDTEFADRVQGGGYVDKTLLIDHLNACVDCPDHKYVCISRPRRFGKTVTAEMLCDYYEKDAASLFDSLNIAKTASYKTHLHKYNVIFINMADAFSDAGHDVKKLRKKLSLDIGTELQDRYPEIDISGYKSLRKKLNAVYKCDKTKFVFIVDEWDCVLREQLKKPKKIKDYLDCLRELFKNKKYLALAYLTGILPIKKYGDHSALNMFDEYSVTNPGVFAPYLGFTRKEVTALCTTHSMSFEEMGQWYDGYTIGKTGHIFNPNSVVKALHDGEFMSYWTRTETWEALAAYLKLNHQGLKDEIVKLLAGETVRVDVSTFENDMTTFKSRDDVLTLLTHLGYLSAEPDNFGDPDFRILRIPNREIRSEFRRVITHNDDYAQTAEAIEHSRELLNALLEGDSDKVAAGVAKAHEEHASILRYNDENSLSCVLSLAFYSARDRYTLIRELPTGKGFADLVYIPRPGADAPALLIELKYYHSAESALTQIKSQHYPKALEAYRGNLILAGISYDKDTKEHSCVIERA